MFSVTEGWVIGGSRFEFSQPPVDVGSLERGAGAAWVLLVVAAHAAVSALTAKDLLDEPAVRQHFKARALDALDDVQLHAALPLDLSLEVFASKAAVSVNHLHSAPPRFLYDLEQQSQGAHPLIQIGGQHDGGQHDGGQHDGGQHDGGQHDGIEEVATAVAQTHALAATDFLGPIIATRPPVSVVLMLWVSITAAVGTAVRP